jgi:hypothetical protein
MSHIAWCLCGHSKDTHDSLGCCAGGCLCKGFIATTSYDGEYGE